MHSIFLFSQINLSTKMSIVKFCLFFTDMIYVPWKFFPYIFLKLNYLKHCIFQDGTVGWIAFGFDVVVL